MNPKMNAQKKEAVALTTTATAIEENETLNRTYLKAALLSILKEKIGQLLFHLNETDEPDCWLRFEISLREYIDLKVNEVQL